LVVLLIAAEKLTRKTSFKAPWSARRALGGPRASILRQGQVSWHSALLTAIWLAKQQPAYLAHAVAPDDDDVRAITPGYSQCLFPRVACLQQRVYLEIVFCACLLSKVCKEPAPGADVCLFQLFKRGRRDHVYGKEPSV